MAKVARIAANDRVKDRTLGSRAKPPRTTRRRRSQYYAFLSYSHKDEELAEWLHGELEDFHVPSALAGKLTANGVIPRTLAPVFRDMQELAAATDLGEEIRVALAASQFLVVLCSPSAAASRWTNAEIETFKRSRPDGCVYAVIASGEPFASDIPGRETEECFPPALRERYDKRGRPTGKRAEPVAADLRGDSDDRRMGFLKLVAGMLGVGLDDLVQRENTRRQRRLAWLSAASLSGMLIASFLAVTAIQSRDAARDQRREAEGLVAFMLGDLKDKLEPIGRLDALDGVGTKVLKYYSEQNAGELSDAGLLQRSRALSLTAQVAYLRGDFDAAARLYREALAGTEEAVRRNPNDPQRLFDDAQNVFWTGDLARRLGQIGAAEASFREYRRLADRMTAIEPDNLKWRMEVQYARENLGIVLMSQRRFTEAGRQFANIIGPMQALSAVDPANRDYQQEVSNALAWLADARQADGQIDQAIALRQQQIALLERASAERAADVAFSAQMMMARRASGSLLATRGRAPAALEQFRLAKAQADRLVVIEPDNSQWKDQATSARLDLAKTHLSLGQNQEAMGEIAEGCSAASALRHRDANVARWRTLQTRCLALRARLALATGHNGDALEVADQALVSARSERSGDLVGDRFSVAAIHRLLGDIHRRSGDLAAAQAEWSAGLGLLPSGVPELPAEMDERAQLLRRLGRAQEAQPRVAHLAAIGYRAPS